MPQVFRISINISLDVLENELKHTLKNAGFVISTIVDFQKTFSDELNVNYRKHKIFSVFAPHLVYEMLMIGASSWCVLPCSIILLESYPGKVEIMLVNATEFIADSIQSHSLKSMAEYMRKSLEAVLHPLEREAADAPDLTTSWS